MQATTILSRPAVSSRAYVTTGQAADYAGVSRNTVKALIASDELQGYRTEGGHWRVSTSSLLSFVDGIEQEDVVEEATAHKGVAIYARVSSNNQRLAGSLDRQIDRLKEEVSEREGIEADVIPIYQDCASAFGNREHLNRLVDAMLDGQVTRIYCEYQDRLSRVPALTCILQHIAKRHGVEIICLDVEETDPTEQDAWIKELIAYITVVSNRVSSAKSRKVTVKEVDEKTIKRLLDLRAKGLSLTEIARRAKAEGLSTTKGELLSYYKCRDMIFNGKGQALAAALGKEIVDPKALVAEFIETNIVKDDTPKARLYSPDVSAAYVAFCEARAIQPLAVSQVGMALNKKFRGCKFKSNGRIAYRGLALAK
ncbi:MAG: recombinase family protein [Candidatus Nealsonbacteria bacterium]|nr:recombinase family protein [Candidatus Nealsonbacteria bacterium]